MVASVPKSQYDDLQKRHENMRKSREREQRRCSRLQVERDQLRAALCEAGDLLYELWEGDSEMLARYETVQNRITAALKMPNTVYTPKCRIKLYPTTARHASIAMTVQTTS